MQCNGMGYAWVTEDDNLWSVLKSVKIEISQQNHFKKLMNKVSYMDRDSFLIIYKSIIRPIIDYGDSVWNPSLKKHIQMCSWAGSPLDQGVSVKQITDCRLRKREIFPGNSYLRSTTRICARPNLIFGLHK